MDKELRENALRRMEAYFGALPTCNRKLDEYAFVLEKLNAWDHMYTYVTDITIFHLMYSDPVRKLQFLSYMEALKKTPEAVQESLRKNFESHFRLSKRWFCNGDAYYYELNPMIYVSQKHLFSFQEIVYTVSSFFELHGKHEECIRDLESSLKAMFGISDLYQIPQCKPESCLFPLRVAKILRRLARLYTLHLNALVEHWLAPNDMGLPKRHIPDSVRGLDIGWWATPVPVGGARTLPQKLKLVFVINHALSRHYLQDPNLSNVVEEIREYETEYGHLSNLVWNTGLKCFAEEWEGGEEEANNVAMVYGKALRDPATMRPLPMRINYPRALSPGYEARRPVTSMSITSMSPTKAAMLEVHMFSYTPVNLFACSEEQKHVQPPFDRVTLHVCAAALWLTVCGTGRRKKLCTRRRASHGRKPVEREEGQAPRFHLSRPPLVIGQPANNLTYKGAQGTPELGSFSAVDLVLLFIIKAIINHVAATVTRECGQAQVYSPDHRSR